MFLVVGALDFVGPATGHFRPVVLRVLVHPGRLPARDLSLVIELWFLVPLLPLSIAPPVAVAAVVGPELLLPPVLANLVVPAGRADCCLRPLAPVPRVLPLSAPVLRVLVLRPEAVAVLERAAVAVVAVGVLRPRRTRRLPCPNRRLTVVVLVRSPLCKL